MRPTVLCSTKRDFQKKIENDRLQLRFCFTSLRDWSKKLAPTSQPIGFETQPNRALVSRVFPRFSQFACLYDSSHWLLDDTLDL